jgi:hypothetical protein
MKRNTKLFLLSALVAVLFIACSGTQTTMVAVGTVSWSQLQSGNYGQALSYKVEAQNLGIADITGYVNLTINCKDGSSRSERAKFSVIKALSTATKNDSADTGGKAVSSVEVKDYSFFIK